MSKSPSSSLYTRAVASTLFPIHEWLKRHHSVSLRNELEASQWLAPEALGELQNQNLSRFVQHLYQHNTYYSGLFKQLDLGPADIRCTADLHKLPLLGKLEIRAHQDALKCQNIDNLLKYNTGGSSGEPLIFYMGMDRVSHDVAAKWRATRWWNVDIGDTEAVIWGSPIELGKQDRIKQLRDWLIRSHLIPAFDLRPESINAYLQQLQQLKPQMVFGYPSVIEQLSLVAEHQGLALDKLGTQVVFTTSEMLYPHQRQQIEKAFGAPVANGYGARDAGFIAHECPQGSLHISAEHIIVEIIDELGDTCPPGTEGEIVVTHMATTGFPFVRYRTGDLGVLDNKLCTCGRGLPVLREVQGRSTDFITATDGAKVHALALIYILREIAGVEQFKVVQRSSHQTEIQLRTNARFDAGITDGIKSSMQQRLGADMEITVELLSHFPVTKNGKFRYVEDLR